MQEHRRVLELSGHAGQVLLRNGAEIYRVQETMTHILDAFSIKDYNVYVISNGIFATVDEHTDDAISLVRHVPLGSVHLSRIDAVNQVSRRLCNGSMTLDEAEAALDRIEVMTVEKPFAHVLACGLGAAGFCVLFGGTLPEGLAAFPIGMLLQLYLFWAGGKQSDFVAFIAGSMLVTLTSGLVTAIFPSLALSRVVIGGIVPLVPGVGFSTSARDFFNGDYVSGIIHFIAAVLTAVCIALGVCGGVFLLHTLGGAA